MQNKFIYEVIKSHVSVNIQLIQFFVQPRHMENAVEFDGAEKK